MESGVLCLGLANRSQVDGGAVKENQICVKDWQTDRGAVLHDPVPAPSVSMQGQDRLPEVHRRQCARPDFARISQYARLVLTMRTTCSNASELYSLLSLLLLLPPWPLLPYASTRAGTQVSGR